MPAALVLEALVVRGSLAEGADDAQVGPGRPGLFRLEAQCRLPSDARVVLRIAVERGAWEPLRLAVQPCLMVPDSEARPDGARREALAVSCGQ